MKDKVVFMEPDVHAKAKEAAARWRVSLKEFVRQSVLSAARVGDPIDPTKTEASTEVPTN